MPPGNDGTSRKTFQAAKGHVGLDQHQVRTWDSWHRWTTLTTPAHTFLAANIPHTENQNHAHDLIQITVAEARRLLLAT